MLQLITVSVVAVLTFKIILILQSRWLSSHLKRRVRFLIGDR